MFEDLRPGEAIAVDWTAAEYHADRTCVNNSAIGLLPDKPADFRDHEAGEAIDDSTPAMVRGTRLHLAVLEPEEWRNRLAFPEPPRPPGIRKGTEAYVAWQQAVANHRAVISQLRAAGKDPIPIDAAKRIQIEEMAASVRRHPFAEAVLGLEGRAEQTIVWRETATGILVKVRVDWLAWVDDETASRFDLLAPGWAVVDVKSTIDSRAGPFFRSARKFGYPRQAALYSDAVRAWKRGEPVTHYLFAVEPEWRYDAACWRLPDDEIQRGREECRRALAVLMEHRFTNDWRRPEQRDCCMLVPPWRKD